MTEMKAITEPEQAEGELQEINGFDMEKVKALIPLGVMPYSVDDDFKFDVDKLEWYHTLEYENINQQSLADAKAKADALTDGQVAVAFINCENNLEFYKTSKDNVQNGFQCFMSKEGNLVVLITACFDVMEGRLEVNGVETPMDDKTFEEFISQTKESFRGGIRPDFKDSKGTSVEDIAIYKAFGELPASRIELKKDSSQRRVFIQVKLNGKSPKEVKLGSVGSFLDGIGTGGSTNIMGE